MARIIKLQNAALPITPNKDSRLWPRIQTTSGKSYRLKEFGDLPDNWVANQLVKDEELTPYADLFEEFNPKTNQLVWNESGYKPYASAVDDEPVGSNTSVLTNYKPYASAIDNGAATPTVKATTLTTTDATDPMVAKQMDNNRVRDFELNTANQAAVKSQAFPSTGNIRGIQSPVNFSDKNIQPQYSRSYLNGTYPLTVDEARDAVNSQLETMNASDITAPATGNNQTLPAGATTEAAAQTAATAGNYRKLQMGSRQIDYTPEYQQRLEKKIRDAGYTGSEYDYIMGELNSGNLTGFTTGRGATFNDPGDLTMKTGFAHKFGIGTSKRKAARDAKYAIHDISGLAYKVLDEMDAEAAAASAKEEEKRKEEEAKAEQKRKEEEDAAKKKKDEEDARRKLESEISFAGKDLRNRYAFSGHDPGEAWDAMSHNDRKTFYAEINKGLRNYFATNPQFDPAVHTNTNKIAFETARKFYLNKDYDENWYDHYWDDENIDASETLDMLRATGIDFRNIFNAKTKTQEEIDADNAAKQNEITLGEDGLYYQGGQPYTGAFEDENGKTFEVLDGSLYTGIRNTARANNQPGSQYSIYYRGLPYNYSQYLALSLKYLNEDDFKNLRSEFSNIEALFNTPNIVNGNYMFTRNPQDLLAGYRYQRTDYRVPNMGEEKYKIFKVFNPNTGEVIDCMWTPSGVKQGEIRNENGVAVFWANGSTQGIPLLSPGAEGYDLAKDYYTSPVSQSQSGFVFKKGGVLKAQEGTKMKAVKSQLKGERANLEVNPLRWNKMDEYALQEIQRHNAYGATFGQMFDENYQFTDSDIRQLGALGADIASAALMFVPGAGLVSSGVGALGTLTRAYDDYKKNGLSWGLVGETGVGLAFDAMALAGPLGGAGKLAKITKALQSPIGKGIMYLLMAAGSASGAKGLYNIITKGKDADMDDLRMFINGVNSVGGFTKLWAQAKAMKNGKSTYSFTQGKNKINFETEAGAKGFQDALKDRKTLAIDMDGLKEKAKQAQIVLNSAEATADQKTAANALLTETTEKISKLTDKIKTNENLLKTLGGADFDPDLDVRGKEPWNKYGFRSWNGENGKRFPYGRKDIALTPEVTTERINLTDAEAATKGWFTRYGHKLNTTYDWFGRGLNGARGKEGFDFDNSLKEGERAIAEAEANYRDAARAYRAKKGVSDPELKNNLLKAKKTLRDAKYDLAERKRIAGLVSQTEVDDLHTARTKALGEEGRSTQALNRFKDDQKMLKEAQKEVKKAKDALDAVDPNDKVALALAREDYYNKVNTENFYKARVAEAQYSQHSQEIKDLNTEMTANKRSAYDELGKMEISDAQEEYAKLTKEYNKALKEYNKNRTQANKDKLFDAKNKLEDAVNSLHSRRAEYNDVMLDAGSDEYNAALAANKRLFGADYKGDILTVETNRSQALVNQNIAERRSKPAAGGRRYDLDDNLSLSNARILEAEHKLNNLRSMDPDAKVTERVWVDKVDAKTGKTKKVLETKEFTVKERIAELEKIQKKAEADFNKQERASRNYKSNQATSKDKTVANIEAEQKRMEDVYNKALAAGDQAKADLAYNRIFELEEMKVNYSTGATTANLENRPSITAADKLANDQYAKGLTLEARARAAQQHGKTRREIEELRRLRTKQANSYRENKSVNSFKESIYSKASNPQSSTAAEHARNARTEAANMDPLKAQHGQAQAAIESKQSEITKLKDTIKKQTKEAKSLTGDALTKKTAQIDRNKKALNKKKAELTILKKDQKAIGYDEKAHENLIRGTKDYDKIEETIKNSDKFKGEIKQQAAEIKEYYKNVLGKKPNELKNIDFEQLAVERIADQMVRNGVITDFTELDANRLAALQDLYGKSTALNVRNYARAQNYQYQTDPARGKLLEIRKEGGLIPKYGLGSWVKNIFTKKEQTPSNTVAGEDRSGQGSGITKINNFASNLGSNENLRFANTIGTNLQLANSVKNMPKPSMASPILLNTTEAPGIALYQDTMSGIRSSVNSLMPLTADAKLNVALNLALNENANKYETEVGNLIATNAYTNQVLNNEILNKLAQYNAEIANANAAKMDAYNTTLYNNKQAFIRSMGDAMDKFLLEKGQLAKQKKAATESINQKMIENTYSDRLTSDYKAYDKTFRTTNAIPETISVADWLETQNEEKQAEYAEGRKAVLSKLTADMLADLKLLIDSKKLGGYLFASGGKMSDADKAALKKELERTKAENKAKLELAKAFNKMVLEGSKAHLKMLSLLTKENQASVKAILNSKK